MTFDTAADFAAVCDGLEAVTLLRRGDAPNSPGLAVTHALRRPAGTREAAALAGRCSGSDVVWHLSAAELDAPPQPGDVVRAAAGQRWTILEATETTLGSRWRCLARNIAVAYGLDDSVTVLRAVFSKGAGGAADVTWITWKTGVRARVQPTDTRTEVQHEAAMTERRCLIFMEEDLSLDHTHRIVGPDAAVYKVLGSRSAQQIGELAVIEAEATPWP
jgi:hypothetical protein